MANSNLPEAAQTKLCLMQGTDEKRGIFTSDLSVNEFLLVKEAGFAPLGLVMGSSVYHVGYQFIFSGMFGSFWEDQELEVATQATYNARMLAMNRMLEEAEELDADGIIGVKFQLPTYDWGKELLQLVIIGTAVKQTNEMNVKGPGNRPFTSNLSGQDFWTLFKAGHRPFSLVMGNCIYALRQQGVAQRLKQLGRNAEVQNYTQALYAARELAQSRMLAEVKAKGAKGVTGVNIEEKVHPHTDGNNNIQYYTVDYFSVGTAVLPLEGKEEIASPLLVQPVSG